ncbi:hypothetical protein GCM10025792_31300 [Pseudonocardia tropica]
MRAGRRTVRDGWSRVVVGGFHDVGRRSSHRSASTRSREVLSLLTGSQQSGNVALVTPSVG